MRTLSPYEGKWTSRQAAQLLRRCQFGASAGEIADAEKAGLQKTVNRLTTPQPEAPAFTEPEQLLREAALATENISDLKAWWLYRMLYSANPFREKLTLFWHNHFATSNQKVRSAAAMYVQNQLMRRYALGDFARLLQEMSKDGAMLIWLDGNANRKRAPNENYARELMELFSLGVGNYTEQDVKEAARAFTGWHVKDEQFWYNRQQHDEGVKTLLGRKGNLDGADVVEICLAQKACPRFLATKLLKFLVLPSPTSEMIDDLAGAIRRNEFDFQKVTAELLTSKLFYSDQALGSLIKSPLDYVLGTQRTLEADVKLGPTARALARLGQDVFEPPTVKGWEGNRQWINSALLLDRVNIVASIVTEGRFGELPDMAEYLSRHDLNNEQAATEFFCSLLVACDVDSKIKHQLATHAERTNGDVDSRVRQLLQVIVTLPEYQLF